MALIQAIQAPFTPEQVANLNGYQESGKFHPFTCGNDACPAVGGQRGVLTAREYGWVCLGCDYTQDWAHAAMADGSWRQFEDITVIVGGLPVEGEIGVAAS